MEKNRNVKIIAIVALFIGILGLTLGFASFSSMLKISSKATVSPDDSSFKVELSSVENEVRDGNVSAKVGNGSVATIVNGTSPTISGLVANFTKPGESVSYEFYAINTGDLDAILNKVDFTTISGTDKKTCVPTGTGNNVADPTLLANACNDIRVSITVASEERACDTSTYGNHPLNVGDAEKVTLVIEYATEGTRVDGPFRVNFGDIRLNYSTLQDGTKNISSCTKIISDVYQVTYSNMNETGLPVTVMEGSTLDVSFATAPEAIEVKVDGVVVNSYTYSEGHLTMPNVEGNVEITKKNLYNVTYNNVTGSNLPNRVVEGGTLNVPFSAVGDELEVKVNNVVTSNYTYSGGVLTVPNVTGNVTITKKNAYSVTYTDVTGSNLPNRVVEGKTLTATFSSAPGAVKVTMGGVETTNYTLSGTTLTVSNVTGNVEIRKKAVYSVTYSYYIVGSNLPTTIEEGGTLEMDVYSSNCARVGVQINGVNTTNFTYVDRHLTVPNVNGNVRIVGSGICYELE